MTQEIFDAITMMEQLEGLYIKWSRINSISSITRLKKVKHLHIGSSTRIQDLATVSKMDHLHTLALENNKALEDLSFIRALSRLEGLEINGSNWTFQKVKTLLPVINLSYLRYVILWGTRVLDGSLMPLGELKELQRIDTAQFYAQEEYQYLVDHLPKLKYGNVLTEAVKEDKTRRSAN